MDYIAKDNPDAALSLDEDFEAHANRAVQDPSLYKPGRVKGTREIVVRPSYVMVYQVRASTVVMLRVLHATQQWPPASPTKRIARVSAASR